MHPLKIFSYQRKKKCLGNRILLSGNVKKQNKEPLLQSHSIDEAEHQHELKKDIEETIEKNSTAK